MVLYGLCCSVLFSVQVGQIYMTGAIFHPHPNINPINTNPNLKPDPNPDTLNTNINVNPDPKNPNHNYTQTTENSHEQIQLSVSGDRKYHLWSINQSINQVYYFSSTLQARFHKKKTVAKNTSAMLNDYM